jgi:hypothetical protein
VSQRPSEELSCPSGHCIPGSRLIGIVGADGRLGYVTPPLEVDVNFVEISQKGRAPESRFRFAEPCLGRDCQHWTGNECGLIGQICAGAASHLALPDEPALPKCGIRSSCRWFSQRGNEACRVCPLVVRVPRVPHTNDQPQNISLKEIPVNNDRSSTPARLEGSAGVTPARSETE